MEVATDNTDLKLKSCCHHVERHLRLAISDWYHLLSKLSLSSDTWLFDCEWWKKQVPSQLDLPWAFDNLHQSILRPGMFHVLMTRVDEICLSMQRHDSVDYPKSMKELRSSLETLESEMRSCNVSV